MDGWMDGRREVGLRDLIFGGLEGSRVMFYMVHSRCAGGGTEIWIMVVWMRH